MRAMYPSPNQHLPSARPALLIRSADTWPTRRQAEARGCFNSLAPALLCPAASLLFLATGVFPPVLWDTNAITPATSSPNSPHPHPQAQAHSIRHSPAQAGAYPGSWSGRYPDLSLCFSCLTFSPTGNPQNPLSVNLLQPASSGKPSISHTSQELLLLDLNTFLVPEHWV